jgi:hypothetical protein
VGNSFRWLREPIRRLNARRAEAERGCEKLYGSAKLMFR